MASAPRSSWSISVTKQTYWEFPSPHGVFIRCREIIWNLMLIRAYKRKITKPGLYPIINNQWFCEHTQVIFKSSYWLTAEWLSKQKTSTSEHFHFFWRSSLFRLQRLWQRAKCWLHLNVTCGMCINMDTDTGPLVCLIIQDEWY